MGAAKEDVLQSSLCKTESREEGEEVNGLLKKVVSEKCDALFLFHNIHKVELFGTYMQPNFLLYLENNLKLQT